LKKKLQNQSSPRPLRRFFLQLFRMAGFAAGLLILLALFHLLTIGLPAPLTRRITEHLREQKIPLHIESITLSLRHGWVLRNPRLYSSSPDHLEPVVKTEKLYLHIRPARWTDLSDPGWKISISGQNIETAPGPILLPAALSSQTISRLQAHLEISRGTLRLNHAELQFENLLLRASGQIALSRLPPPGKTLPDTLIQAHAARILDVAADISFDSVPEINLMFDIPPDGFEHASAQITFFAPGLQWKNNRYRHLGGSFSFEKQQLSLDSLQITAAGGSALSVMGGWDIPNRSARITLSSSLPAENLLALLPENPASKLDQTGIRPFGKMEFDLIAGPAEPEKLAEQLTLHMHSMQIRRNDLTLSPLRFDLTRNGQQLRISNLKAEANGDPLSGEFCINLVSNVWNASATARILPALIGPLLGKTSQEWIDRFEFSNQPPDIAVTMSKGGKSGTFQMETTVSGRDFSCVGIPFDSMDMTLSYSNRIFSLAPLHAAREGRSFRGTVQLDFEKKLAFFDADSSIKPPVIARIIAPDYPTVLTNFTFSGPVSCRASGRIDYSGGTDHAASGTIRTGSVSAKGLTAESFSSRVEAGNDRLIFSDSTAELFGGRAEGSGVFDLRFNDQQAPYRLDVGITRLDLNRIARHFSTNSFNEIKGQVSGTLHLAADASNAFWDSVDGSGEINIEKGQLKDLPVLGGFSRFIRTTLPGFSLFSLTTLYSEYELHDGMLRTGNLELGGTLLSAKARGTWSPAGGLDFIVQAEPLRQTRENKEWYMLHLWLAEVLKEGTAPFFQLLEFELRGPISNPQWRLINLPKEVSEIMQPDSVKPSAP
jgi:hypothetical protein